MWNTGHTLKYRFKLKHYLRLSFTTCNFMHISLTVIRVWFWVTFFAYFNVVHVLSLSLNFILISPGCTWKYLRGKPQFPGTASFHSGLWHFFPVNGVGKFSWSDCEKDCRRLRKTTIVFKTHIIFVLLCIVLTFQITV